MEKKYLITAEYGLHARPATKIVNIAMGFKSEVFMVAQEKKVNLKSIMGVMSLGIYKGEKISIIAEGDDQFDAINKIGEFLISQSLGKEVE